MPVCVSMVHEHFQRTRWVHVAESKRGHTHHIIRGQIRTSSTSHTHAHIHTRTHTHAHIHTRTHTHTRTHHRHNGAIRTSSTSLSVHMCNGSMVRYCTSLSARGRALSVSSVPSGSTTSSRNACASATRIQTACE